MTKEQNDTSVAAPEQADESALELRYRTVVNGIPPRPIKLSVPGWAGESRAHGNGARPMPWHCQPFVDGSTYGLELLYPYRTECRVSCDESGIQFEGDFAEELAELQGMAKPFDRFAPHHYGLASCLDLLPPPGYALRLEPHPRFFTDTTGTVPLAVPGHLQRYWPRPFFVVFKAPPAGSVHVFRPGEPFAQVLLVRSTVKYRITEMEPETAQERATQDSIIGAFRFLLAKHIWRADSGNWFDDVYKQLGRRHRTQGDDGVREWLLSMRERADRGQS